jgi:ATP-dependent DNA helicase RecG
VHPDRVTIRSPGGLPEPVTLANIREQNAPRNLTVIQALRRFRLAEDAGMGVDLMEDAMAAALLDPPEFAADESHVAVTLHIGSTVTPQERAWIGEVERRGDIRNNDKLVLIHAARGELITNSSVRRLLGADSTHARAALHRLRDQGFLAQSGTRGGACYVLPKELGPPAGMSMGEGELRALVLQMARQSGRIANEDVRNQTGLDRAQALSLLSALVADGELQSRGKGRGVVYEPARAEK